jgi:hypothetical protein
LLLLLSPRTMRRGAGAAVVRTVITDPVRRMRGMIEFWSQTGSCGTVRGEDGANYFLRASVLRAGGYVTREQVGEGRGWRRKDGTRTDYVDTVEPAANERCIWEFDARSDPQQRGDPVITRIRRKEKVEFTAAEWKPDHSPLPPYEEPPGPPAGYNEPMARRLALDNQLVRYHTEAGLRSDKNAPASAPIVPAGAAGLPLLPAAAAVQTIVPAAAAGAAPPRQRERDGGSSIAGEIRELHELQKVGALTDDEFTALKAAAIAKYRNAADL